MIIMSAAFQFRHGIGKEISVIKLKEESQTLLNNNSILKIIPNAVATC